MEYLVNFLCAIVRSLFLPHHLFCFRTNFLLSNIFLYYLSCAFFSDPTSAVIVLNTASSTEPVYLLTYHFYVSSSLKQSHSCLEANQLDIYIYLYRYMKFFIIFTSTHSINKFRYRRRIHETSKSHIQRINIVQLALRLLITKWTFEKHIEGDGRFWDQSPMDSKLKTWYQAMRSTWEEIEGFETWVKSLTRNKKGSVKRNLKSEILARGEMTITS